VTDRPVDTVGLHRSYLYVVGHREDQIEKAYSSEVDAVILELEDAVAPSMKEQARRTVARLLREPLPKPTWIRVNQLGSGLTRADVDAVAGAAIEGVRLPKTQSADDVVTVATWLEETASGACIQAVLETALAVERVAEIARAHPRLAGVSLGEQDLQADLGAADEGLRYARSRVVLAARAAGLPAPVQSVWTRLRDLDGLRESCLEGKRYGFYGRSALHPRQLSVINEVFTPTPEEVAEAQDLQHRLREAVATGAAGLQLPDGRFVDQAVVLAAERTLSYGARAAGPAGSVPPPGSATGPGA
jgi:citrate lyase subunit beta/citryl-CoA lyase